MRKTQIESWEMEWFQAHDRFQAQRSFWSKVQIKTETKILKISGKKSFIKARNPWIKTNSRGGWSKRYFPWKKHGNFHGNFQEKVDFKIFFQMEKKGCCFSIGKENPMENLFRKSILLLERGRGGQLCNQINGLFFNKALSHSVILLIFWAPLLVFARKKNKIISRF